MPVPHRFRRLTLALAPGCAVLLAACSAGSEGGSTGTNFVSGDGTLTTLAADQREEPVTFTAQTLDGVPLALTDSRGSVVVLNVWGSWCGPCREEAPALQESSTELAPEGVTFVGINTRDNTAAAQAFERTFGLTYPSVVDDGGDVLLSLRGAVPPNAVPTTLVLDEQGRVAARVTGPVEAVTLTALVRDVLAEDA